MSLIYVRFTKVLTKWYHSSIRTCTLHKYAYCLVDFLVTLHLTRNPAIAEGPRDAGVPVEIW